MTHRFGRTAKETLLKATRLFIARKTLLRTFRKAVRCLSVPVPYKKRTYLPSLQDNIIKVWDVHTPPTVSPFPRIVSSQQYMMDASLLASATTTAAAHTIAAAASTTVVATMARSGQRNGTHRGAVNVHGRLMYDEIVINDVWINAILSTLALACAACVCLCFLYCKIQQWKHGVQRRRNEKNSRKYDADSLPSYTIVTGLPTYDEAVERMNGGHNYGGGASSIRDNKPPSKHVSVSVVHVRDDLPTPPKPDPKFGLVSHSLFVHDDGCSHCLSVQELLETYNVR